MLADTIVIECGWCDKHLPNPSVRAMRKAAAGGKVFCSLSCSAKFRCGPITCEIHGPQEKSIQLKCLKCHHDKVHGPMLCDVHGPQERSFNGKCISCNHDKLKGPITCEIHGEQDRSVGGKCINCEYGPINCKIHGPQEKSFKKRCFKCIHGPVTCDVHGLQEVSVSGACPKCRGEELHGPVTCDTHGLQKRSIRGNCAKCLNSKTSVAITCDTHGEQPVSLAGSCYYCISAKVNGPLVCDTHGEQPAGFGGKCPKCAYFPTDCDIHGFQETSFHGKCFKCHNFELNKPIDCEKHGLQDFSFGGFCVRCVERTIKCSWLHESPECEAHPDEAKQALRFGTYECWSCVKDEFRLKSTDRLEISGSMWISTYRLKEESSAGQFMMEQELKELGVKWFVYLKGYIKEDVWAPLVVGKTGSKLVNSQTDIGFRYDGENPGRTFLRESDLIWDTSKILIIPCDSETDALEYEKALCEELGLFYS